MNDILRSNINSGVFVSKRLSYIGSDLDQKKIEYNGLLDFSKQDILELSIKHSGKHSLINKEEVLNK